MHPVLKTDPLTINKHGLLCIEMNMEAELLFWCIYHFLQNVYLALSCTECLIQIKHLKRWSGKTPD